jgi:competence protein ComGC
MIEILIILIIIMILQLLIRMNVKYQNNSKRPNVCPAPQKFKKIKKN